MYLNTKDKTMKFTNITLISMMSLLMVACGGGGESSSANSSSNTTTTVAPIEPIHELVAETTTEPITDEPVLNSPVVSDDVTPDPNAVYDSTAELIAAKSFLLEPEFQLAVRYKNNDNRRAYLSICSEFTQGEAGFEINYNSCLLRSSIESDYSATLSVANDKNQLVMAIWYLDDAQNPRYETWENSYDAKAPKVFNVN